MSLQASLVHPLTNAYGSHNFLEEVGDLNYGPPQGGNFWHLVVLIGGRQRLANGCRGLLLAALNDAHCLKKAVVRADNGLVDTDHLPYVGRGRIFRDLPVSLNNFYDFLVRRIRQRKTLISHCTLLLFCAGKKEV